MRILAHTACLFALLVAGLSGCQSAGNADEFADARTEVADSGRESADAGAEITDGGSEIVDGGNEVTDAGNEVADGGIASPVSRIHADGTFEVEVT